MALGKALPALVNRPSIPPDLFYIWEAFWVLNGSRSMGFGIGPIPLTEIKAYIELFQVVDLQMFVACVRALDRQYLQEHYKKRERESGSK